MSLPAMNKNLIQLPSEPHALMETWQPRLRFEIPSELQSDEYLYFLHSLFVEFVRKVEPKRAEWNEYNAFKFGKENGSEGGMGGFQFQGAYFSHCKLYGYDGSRSGQNYAGWKGFMIRNHEDQRSRTSILYAIADGLEVVLREKEVAYERYGMRVGSHEEELQSQFSHG